MILSCIDDVTLLVSKGLRIAAQALLPSQRIIGILRQANLTSAMQLVERWRIRQGFVTDMNLFTIISGRRQSNAVPSKDTNL
jgi:hypothetical protein